MKKANVNRGRWMAGDTWSKSRSERLLRQQQTHTHIQRSPSNCHTLYTNTHSCQGQTKIIHKTPTPPPPPWVSLTQFLPHRHTPCSLSHTHTHSCREAACCPCGLWRIITQQCRLKSPEWTSFSNARSSSSPRHRPWLNSSWKLLCVCVCYFKCVLCLLDRKQFTE